MPTKIPVTTPRTIRAIIVAVGMIEMGKKRLPGHYCKVCGMHKSNESFSGKGRAAHICKVCSRLTPAQQAEQMTPRRLENLPMRRLSESEMTWLKNRTHDHRPNVKSLACLVYAERFPRQARNQKKRELSIQRLELCVNGEVCDLYGNWVNIREGYRVCRTPPAITRTLEDGALQTVGPPPKVLAKLLKWTVHTLEIYWWGQDFCDPANDEFRDTQPSVWNIHVEYSNGEVQDAASTDMLPDHVEELLSALSEFFE